MVFTRLTGFVVLGLALLLPAYAAPPYAFPDQPGVLSPAEKEDATRMMKMVLGTEPALPLVASGRRSPEHTLPGYALFAAPLADFSAGVKVRRQIVCNFFRPAGKWQCSNPHDEFRMSANGLEHIFNHQIIQGTGNKQAAVEAAAFMYSQCFGTQFKAIGGEPFTPSPDADFVSGVLDDGKGFNIVTGPIGDGNSYRLVKTDKSADNCAFRIQHARMAKSGVMIPENAAKEYDREMEKLAAQEHKRLAEEKQLAMAKQEAQERKDFAAERNAAEERARAQSRVTLGPWSIEGEDIATVTMFGAMISGALALVIPWSMLGLGKWPAAYAGGALALLCTIMAAVSAAYMPGKYNIRIDLLINGFLMVVAWARFVSLAFQATAAEPVRYGKVRLGLWTLLVALVIFPVGLVALMSVNAFESPVGPALSMLLLWPSYAAALFATGTVTVFALSSLFHFLYCFAIVWIVSWLWSKRGAASQG